MRYFLITSIGLLPSSLLAQEVGDTIIAISDAELNTGSAVVETVSRGVDLQVERVDGERLGVFWRGHEGWIHRSDVIPFDQGLKYFADAVRRDPSANNHVLYGIILEKSGNPDKAIDQFNAAIRLNPKYASAYNSRGSAWRLKGDREKAFSDFNEAIRLNPTDAIAYSNRGVEWSLKGNLDRAISDFEKAISLDAKEAAPYNNLAWLYATARKDEYRNGEKAVENGTKGCELTNWKKDAYIETLAAAYAEKGDFDEAIKWLQKAMELGPNNFVEVRKKMLELFESGRPYRE